MRRRQIADKKKDNPYSYPEQLATLFDFTDGDDFADDGLQSRHQNHNKASKGTGFEFGIKINSFHKVRSKPTRWSKRSFSTARGRRGSNLFSLTLVYWPNLTFVNALITYAMGPPCINTNFAQFRNSWSFWQIFPWEVNWEHAGIEPLYLGIGDLFLTFDKALTICAKRPCVLLQNSLRVKEEKLIITANVFRVK